MKYETGRLGVVGVTVMVLSLSLWAISSSISDIKNLQVSFDDRMSDIETRQAPFDGRISTLENGQAYTFEIIRQRPVSAEFCKELSDDKMACTTNAQRLCRCTFSPDQQDIEQRMMREEIARRLDEEKAAAAAAAEKGAAKPEPEE